MAQTTESGAPINLSASGIVSKQPGSLLGFYVNSTSSGTLVIHDATAATNAISGTITPAIGYHRFPAALRAGCYFECGGTVNVTGFVQA